MSSGCSSRFGAAELATMIVPRSFAVEDSVTPVVSLPGDGGVPAKIARPDRLAVACRTPAC